jgi:membrane fusion protein, heavy metal efflux system
MEIKNINPILLCFVCLSIVSCSQKSSNNSGIIDTTNIEVISLTPDQLVQTGIKTERIRKLMISDIIYCAGTIEASPNHEAYVSVPINGYMKKILKHIGEYVKKGQVLAILEHPDYIDLQRDFLETKSQYNYYKEDFKRQGELSLENATSLKKMQSAQNEFRKIEARFFALKEHLEFIGINTDSLFVDRIKSSILLKAPISGYITKSEGKIGQLYTTDNPIFQIISNTNAILHLKVFASEAWKIAKNQNVEFNTIQDQLNKYKAVIISSTKSVDEDNVINLHARIMEMDNNLMPGMYVKAKIIVDADSVYALNNQAIVKHNESYFIFIKSDSIQFIPRKIEIGRTNNDFTEIVSMSSDLLDVEIVTSGAYYLQSKLIEE